MNTMSLVILGLTQQAWKWDDKTDMEKGSAGWVL